MEDKLLIRKLLVFFLVFSFGCCKYQHTSPDSKWTKDEEIITFKMEYNSDNKLERYTKLVNKDISSYYTFEYSDTSVIQKISNKDHEQLSRTVYILDANKRAIKYYETNSMNETTYITSLTYSPSGFPDTIIVEDVLNNRSMHGFINNNGEDIILENIDMLYLYYEFSDIKNIQSIPYDLNYQLIPNYLGIFGKGKKHLLHSYQVTPAGPGSIYGSYRFIHTLDADGKVIGVKKYKKKYGRYQKPPLYGTIQYIKYEYIFN